MLLPWILIGLAMQNASADSVAMNLQGVGNVKLDIIQQTSNVKGVEAGFGTLTFKHGMKHGDEAIQMFNAGIADPSMFMSSPVDHLTLPGQMSFAIVGNITADINAVTLNCGMIHIGHSKLPKPTWWFGSPHCAKEEIDPVHSPRAPGNDLETSNKKYGGAPSPPIPPSKQYQFVCPCDGGAYVQFSQPGEKGKKAHHDVSVGINDCTVIKKKVGQWVETGSSPGPQQYEFDYGVTRSYTVTKSKQWAHSTTESVTAGFSFGGFSLSTTVSHTSSYQFSVSHSQTFSMTSSEKYSTSIGKGVVWQFQMGITDNCGTSGIHMKDIQVTDTAQQPPCCLPGYFKNISDPMGDCITVDGEEYNVCKNSTKVFVV